MKDWLGLIGSVLGGLIGGIFTFLGVKQTIKHEKSKERKAILLKANENKPRLEIVKYSSFNDTINDKTINNDCNVIALKIEDVICDEEKLCFIYDKAALDSENLIFVEYKFKNTGNTEIEDICITSNLPKNMSVFELERKKFYIDNNILNYDVFAHKRYVKPGQVIKIRIYYIKDKVINNFLSHPFTIWLHDINGRYWRQSFNSPIKEIEISSLSSRNDFIASTDVDKAIECFKKPYLW